MNFRSYILFLFIVAFWIDAGAQDFRKQAPNPGPAPKIEIGDYETFTLPNGLTGIVVENHKLPRVSIQLSIDLPLIAEGEKSGTADIAGELLTKGTASRKKSEIDEAIDFIGASLGSSAGGVSGASLTKHKDKLMEILADVVLHPSFPAEEFEKLKTQTLSGLAANKTDPNAIAANVSNVLTYGKDHPYGELTTEETVQNITLEDAKAFYETYFQPSRAYFVVTGDITLKDAKKMAKKYFKKWQGKAVMENNSPMPEKPQSTELDFVDKPGAVQSMITITYPVDLKPGDPQSIAARVLNTILGGGSSGRLYTNLREDKGYTYGAYSSITSDEHVGSFSADGSVRNEVTDSAIVEFMSEIRRLRTEPVSQAELEQAKNVVAGSFARSLESPQTVASFALNTVLYNLPEDYYATYLERLSKLTQDDVMKAAQRFIHPDRAHIIVVGNRGEVAEKLGRFDADQKVNYYDVYGRPVKMEEFGVPEGVTAQAVIDNYLAAIGGKQNLMAIEDITLNMSASLQGQTLESTLKYKTPNMMTMEMKASGMTIVSQKFDGVNGMAVQMGQVQELDEAALTEMKAQAYLVPELYLEELGYSTELKGVEMVEGKKAYALEMTSSAGNKTTDYYDITTGLKIRSIATPEGNTLTTDFADYQEVDGGIKLPFKNTIDGMLPIPLTMEVQSVKVNSGLDKAEFEVKK